MAHELEVIVDDVNGRHESLASAHDVVLERGEPTVDGFYPATVRVRVLDAADERAVVELPGDAITGNRIVNLRARDLVS